MKEYQFSHKAIRISNLVDRITESRRALSWLSGDGFKITITTNNGPELITLRPHDRYPKAYAIFIKSLTAEISEQMKKEISELEGLEKAPSRDATGRP